MQIPASLRSDFIHIASERSIHIVGIRNNGIRWVGPWGRRTTKLGEFVPYLRLGRGLGRGEADGLGEG
jgi:hypothetical protein